ncbi:uncharacterized protein BDR25DRAFT_380686 [Lindgomyces ingoldianus]|uniref:Uncharacterized protein n=1 Tax=Lindgomyces ingoldianus TaxID=673940 RepID=A0ACB6QCY0_9PLEO|nr:uncharacterized protein BDR25DRAFT_380686 [Lindgomyces ingoldianus]KAF2464776.1 hypothetical protein BDR25DRAFT_380686 [Lindgomyces ingoldianus]
MGTNGFVASHILFGLVERNYHIVATVQAEGAYDEAFRDGGFDYIIHNASPLNFTMGSLLRTARLITCAHKSGGPSLKRFVLLGSAVAVLNEFEDISIAEKLYTEVDWNPVTAEHGIEKKEHYHKIQPSKKLDEQAGRRYMEEHNLNFDLAVINLDIIIGPMFQNVPGPHSANETNEIAIYNFMNGKYTSIDGLKYPFYHFVDVRDVALAHILVRTISAAGTKRIILVSGLISPQIIINTTRKHFPELKDRIIEGHPEQLLPPGVDPTGWDSSRSLEIFGPDWK